MWLGGRKGKEGRGKKEEKAEFCSHCTIGYIGKKEKRGKRFSDTEESSWAGSAWPTIHSLVDLESGCMPHTRLVLEKNNMPNC